LLEGLEPRIGPLRAACPAAAVPARGWLRALREAIGLSQAGVAARAGVKRQSLAQFELAEERGSISLTSLRRAAAAMDCELVYFVVPRAAVADSYAGLAQLRDPAARHLKATEHSTALKKTGGADGGS
jgi:predicted DNA-binding mobile mystery protein A